MHPKTGRRVEVRIVVCQYHVVELLQIASNPTQPHLLEGRACCAAALVHEPISPQRYLVIAVNALRVLHAPDILMVR